MMAVYVDKPAHPLGRMIMCHMLADSLEELHAMADKIGISRHHFQTNSSTPHYDICKSKRSLAVKYGAVEADRSAIVNVIRRLRSKRGDS